jgi:hypothetical protein
MFLKNVTDIQTSYRTWLKLHRSFLATVGTVPVLVVTIITILLGRESSDGADPRDDNVRFVEDDPVEALQPERARP